MPLFARRPTPSTSPASTPSSPASPAEWWTTYLSVLWATLWIGLVLNAPTWWRRASTTWSEAPGSLSWSGPMSEMVLVLSVTALLLGLASCFGRLVLRVTVVTMIMTSALCAYYMTRYNVVIGYGVMLAILTTDHDMSREVVGAWMLVWILALGIAPSICLWRRIPTAGLWPARRTPKVLGVQGLSLLVLVALGFSANATLKQAQGTLRQNATDAETNLVGITAHSYVPSNWLAGVGMVGINRWTEQTQIAKLQRPAEMFQYLAPPALDDAVVVLVIGETTRSDHMGLLGYHRDTTPLLRQMPHLAAFRGWSCDTSTKLSLGCMFVRPQGIVQGQGMQPDQILEDNVFSVFKHLRFNIELFAMQSEAGFYARVQPDFYKLREVIAAQAENNHRRLDDLLLVPELRGALTRHPQGRQLIVLHTKGSHFLYSQRYPREFAQWTPECLNADAFCSGDELINAFDNSVRFVDHTLAQFIAELKDRKALLIFSSDHGESISENMHFHATPRRLAPPEQRRIPLLLWASESWMAEPTLRTPFERLQSRAQTAAQRPLDDTHIGHQNLFATLLGCLGVNSPNGGIDPALNLCH